jgi:hypothetical protein
MPFAKRFTHSVLKSYVLNGHFKWVYDHSKRGKLDIFSRMFLTSVLPQMYLSSFYYKVCSCNIKSLPVMLYFYIVILFSEKSFFRSPSKTLILYPFNIACNDSIVTRRS